VTFHISPVVGVVFTVSVLIGLWVFRSTATTDAAGARRNGDLAAAITAAAAAFAVLCVLLAAPAPTTQQQPSLVPSPNPATAPSG
jgi:hypothetical protein